MAKNIDFGDGYVGRVTAFEPGLDSWALVTTSGATVHTGYAKDAEEAEAMMRAFLASGDAAAPAAAAAEAEAATAEAGESAEESAATSDKAADDDSSKKLKGKLPDGFPGKAALDAAGYGTYAKVRKLHDQGKLTEVPGIGEATAGHIGEALTGFEPGAER